MNSTRKNPSRSKSPYEIYTDKNNNQQYVMYEVGKKLGQGGFASVHEIKKKSENFFNAAKIIDLRNKYGSIDKDRQEKANKQIRILREACRGNDKVVQYIHHFTCCVQEIYIIMEYCQLGDLNSVLKKRKQYCEPQVRFFSGQIVPMLLILRERNIIHRDIKLANIFIGEGGRLKIGDFGLAIMKRELSQSKKRSKSVVGTPNYLSPEIVDRKEYSFEVDLWALGVMMYLKMLARYTMLTGRAPFEARTCEQTYNKIRRCTVSYSKKDPEISKEAKDLIAAILKNDPNDRIKLENIMEHPFFTSYPMPKSLEKQFCLLAPSKIWVDKHMTKLPEVKKEEESKTRLVNLVEERSKSMEPITPKKPKTGQKYKNLRKQPEKSREKSKVKVKEERKNIFKAKIIVKAEQDTNHAVNQSILSKLQTSSSLKRKHTQEVEQSTQPKKKFRKNDDNITEKVKEEEQDESETNKHPVDVPKKLKLIYTDQQADNYHLQAFKKLQKDMEGSNLMKIYYNSIPTPKFDFQTNFLEKKKIVWYQFSSSFGLIYQLSTNELGSFFKDGTILLQASGRILKLLPLGNDKYNWQKLYDKKGKNINSQYYPIFTSYCKQLGGFIDTEQEGEKIFVESFAAGKTIKIFNFNNGDQQFIFSDGFTLMFHAKEYYVSCEDGENVGFYPLPIKLEDIQSPSVRDKWQQMAKANEEVRAGLTRTLTAQTSFPRTHTKPCPMAAPLNILEI